jgi:hypothetical protein
MVLFAANASSTRMTERRRNSKKKANKKKTAGRGKSRRREAAKNKVRVARKPPKAKATAPRPLSNEEQIRVDSYFIKRDFPNISNHSNIPL